MKRLLCLIAMILLCLCRTGCRETTESLHDKATKAFLAGGQEEAMRLFKQMIALDPTDLNAHFFLGWIYEMQGKLDEGVAEYEKALAIQPDHAWIHNRLGGIYLVRGMLDEALRAFTTVVMRNPDSATGNYQLGMTYRQMGRTAEAADAFFEAGILAVVSNNKELALNACNRLTETGNPHLAAELQGVLIPWFDPANDVATRPQGSRSRQ